MLEDLLKQGPFYIFSGLGTAKAIMNLNAQLDEELSFSIGDEITITEVLDGGSWYKGCIGSNTGTFPASFVQLLTPLKSSEGPHQDNFIKTSTKAASKAWKEEDLDPISPNKVIGISGHSDPAVEISVEKQNHAKKHVSNGHSETLYYYSEEPTQKHTGKYVPVSHILFANLGRSFISWSYFLIFLLIVSSHNCQ